MKIYFKSLGYCLSIIIVLTFIITLLNCLNIIYGIGLKICKLFIPILATFISGFILGKNSIKKGWLNGCKLGIIIICLFFIFNLICKNMFSIKLLIYYIMLIITCILGSILGINKKNNKECK